MFCLTLQASGTDYKAHAFVGHPEFPHEEIVEFECTLLRDIPRRQHLVSRLPNTAQFASKALVQGSPPANEFGVAGVRREF